MNQLVPASQAGRGVQRAAPAAADVESRRLVDDTWDGAVLGLADVGLTLDTTNAVASAVTSEQGVRRRANGTYFRLRHGWVAYPTSIIVIRFEQELRRWPDGKLHTVGDYQQASTQTYQAVSPAVRRTGAVTEDAGPSDQAPGARAEIDQRLRRRFQVGFDTLAFLPTKIRKDVIARLRNVSVFTGQAGMTTVTGSRSSYSACTTRALLSWRPQRTGTPSAGRPTSTCTSGSRLEQSWVSAAAAGCRPRDHAERPQSLRAAPGVTGRQR